VARPPGAEPLLSVGITAADWMHMGAELGRLEEAGADLVHFDVMDGCFCPQLTVGPQVIGALKTTLRKDVHLMIEEPLDKVRAYLDAGAKVLTFHLEGTRHPHRVLQALGQAVVPGLVRGVALNPGTHVSAIEPLIDQTELILVLAVNPGWGGQRFGPGTERRLEAVREIIERSGRDVMLGVDGGITRDNVGAVARMGVDLIVTGSAVYDGGDVVANLRAMRAAMSGARTG
jgi:ribulose-phosphate 3-epimerase